MMTREEGSGMMMAMVVVGSFVVDRKTVVGVDGQNRVSGVTNPTILSQPRHATNHTKSPTTSITSPTTSIT